MSAGKIDPMEQFLVEPVLGRHIELFGYDVSFTNSALFMVVVFVLLAVFMSGGLKRQLIPGRWQVAAEGAVSFIDNMVKVNIGSGGKKFAPYIFSLFFFILFANLVGVLPLAILPGLHTFAVTSHITVTAVLAFLSFGIVLLVGLWKHGLKFFSLFVPHGTPLWLMWLIPGRTAVVPGAPVQPWAATVRRDDRRAHPARSVRQLRRSGPQRRWRDGPGRQLAQLRDDRRRQRTRIAGLRDSGLCLRAAHLALPS